LGWGILQNRRTSYLNDIVIPTLNYFKIYFAIDLTIYNFAVPIEF